MINLFGVFFMIYMLVLVLHGSLYSGKMQAITRLKEQITKKGANKKEARAQINGKLNKINWMRRITWIIYIILFIVHILLIHIEDKPEEHMFVQDEVYLNACYLFIVVSALLFIMNWIKGTGSIDKKVKFKKTNSPSK